MRKLKHSNYKVQNAYNLYGIPRLAILEECSIPELNDKEIFWTKEFNSINAGLNIVEAGEVGWGVNSNASKYTKRQILKVFAVLYNTFNSAEQIASRCGVPTSFVHTISKGDSHKWLEDEYPQQFAKMRKIAESRVRQKFSSDIIYIKNNIVYLKSPTGEIVKIDTSIREFCRKHNLNSGPMSEVIKGQRNQNKGWTLHAHSKKEV